MSTSGDERILLPIAPMVRKADTTNAINKVGDLGCNTCEWQVRHNPSAQVVMCSHPNVEKNEVKKLFIQVPEVFD